MSANGFTTHPADLVHMCEYCARHVYGKTAPARHYAESVARLLAGTAATESQLIHRRQIGFSLDTEAGAWGLFQVEQGSFMASMARLERDPELRERAERFLYPYGGRLEAIFRLAPLDLLRLSHDWDPLSCLAARLHYFRIPAAIPPSEVGRAEYYKKHYNTKKGKGSPEKYLRDFAIVAPFFGAIL